MELPTDLEAFFRRIDWDGSPESYPGPLPLIQPYIDFTAGRGPTFCCQTFTSTLKPSPGDPTPSPRLLSYLAQLVNGANTGTLSGPPRRDREKDVSTLNAAKFLVKMYRVSGRCPVMFRVYIAPSDISEVEGGLIEICRGKNSFPDQFPEFSSAFGRESVTADLKCAEHGVTWFVQLYERNDVTA